MTAKTVAAFLNIVLLCSAGLRPAFAFSASSASETSAVSVLINEFETVVRLDAAMLRFANRDNPDAMGATLIPAGELLTSLNGLARDAKSDILARTGAVLVGAKKFRPPSSLGSAHYQFCYILVARDGRQFSMKGLARSVSLPGLEFDVWTWSAKFFEENAADSPVYASVISPTYFLVSNNVDDLRVIARQLRGTSRVPQTPIHDTQIDSVRKYQAWGLRRFIPADARLSKSDTSLKVWLAVDMKDRIAFVRLQGGEPNDSAIRTLREAGIALSPSNSDPSVLAGSIRLSSDETAINRVLSVMWILGFAIYI